MVNIFGAVADKWDATAWDAGKSQSGANDPSHSAGNVGQNCSHNLVAVRAFYLSRRIFQLAGQSGKSVRVHSYLY
ncbi:hypothetical protein OA88_22730 [Flavobacterium sp. JRM]|nr:hypothetical protein OA88_22730 [Flavobacterium sp. JRM]